MPYHAGLVTLQIPSCSHTYLGAGGLLGWRLRPIARQRWNDHQAGQVVFANNLCLTQGAYSAQCLKNRSGFGSFVYGIELRTQPLDFMQETSHIRPLLMAPLTIYGPCPRNLIPGAPHSVVLKPVSGVLAKGRS